MQYAPKAVKYFPQLSITENYTNLLL